jgi:Ran GTPase-activating protein (RanGAP) involved in mRNA processing and transport
LLKRVEENDANLTDLVILPSKNFGGPEVKRLAAALSQNTYLKSLSASGHAVPPTALRVLAEAMAQSTTFTKIAVGDKDMGDEGIIALCSSGCGNTEVLDLAYKSVSVKGMKVLGETFGNSTHLMELNLSRNPTIGNQGLVAFCEAISGDILLPNLHTLNLAECEIGAEGVSCLSTLLIQTGCTTLGLASNPLGATSCSSLTPLLNGGKLKTLHLGSCDLTDDGIASLCQAVRTKACTGLETLDLSENGIGKDGATELANSFWFENESCWKALSELKLAGNSIGGAGMTSLAEALSGAKTLQTLDASHTSCEEEGAVSLIGNTGLKRLRLFNNTLGSSGFNALSAVLPECTLLELDLGGNDAGADSVKDMLQTILTTEQITLKVLEIGGNDTSMEVENEVEEIKKVHPGLDIARDKPRQAGEPEIES